MTKLCFRCHKSFSKRKNSKYCSMQCYNPNLRISKICIVCSQKFIVERTRKDTAKYCSVKCKGIDYKKRLKGKNNPFYGKTHINPWNKGKKFPERQGKNHFAWKGEQAGYVSKHMWVSKYFGKPDTCEECSKTGLNGHQIHWANISGEYMREKSDWKRLCVSCHSKYDANKV